MFVSSSTPVKRMAVYSEYAGMLLALGVLIAVFTCLSPRFLTVPTLTAIINQIPALMLVSVGMTLVLVTGGIDLSVGSVLACSSAVAGVLLADQQCPLWLAVPLSLAVGVVCGAINGIVSVCAGLPSFIVTLGVLQIARGAALLVTRSQTKFIGPSLEMLSGRLPVVQLSPAFLLALSVVVACQFLLRRTVFGRYCTAIGTNEAAVRMSGIDPRSPRITVFIISGILAASAGLIETSRISAADPNAAAGFELSAIAAAVIGGTSLMGGRGSAISTFFGVLIIAVLQSGLSQLGVGDGSKKIITGLVIVLAVVIDSLRPSLTQLLERWSRPRQ